MNRRIIILIILIAATTYAPWWLSILFVLGAIWRLGSGYELLFSTMLADLVYGRPIPQLFNFAFPATFLTALLIALSRILGQRFFRQS